MIRCEDCKVRALVCSAGLLGGTQIDVVLNFFTGHFEDGGEYSSSHCALFIAPWTIQPVDLALFLFAVYFNSK